jgi:hypothetical protein
MIFIRKPLSKRGIDDWGNGAFGAPRGGGRAHKGIDFAASVNDEVLSPVKGSVTKLGYPYAAKPGDEVVFRYVEITDYKGNRHRVFYIEPCVGLEQHVDITTVIGLVQDIAGKYHRDDRNPMTNHCHYEIFDPEGNVINPEEFI